MSSNTTWLPASFVPGKKDVIVGRGKVCYKHSGNQRLARIVTSVLQAYSSAGSTKKAKSELIKNIVVQIRESSPEGGFVKYDSGSSKWYEVGDRIAREKVSQTFRDALNDQYKSSTTSKTLKRRQERINRQTSVGSADSSTPCLRKSDPFGKQVDSLVEASSPKLLYPNVPGRSLPTLAIPSGLRLSNFSSTLLPFSYTPSLTSCLMAGDAALNYRTMMMLRELSKQEEVRRTIMFALQKVSL
jgi:hypothetical protein